MYKVSWTTQPNQDGLAEQSEIHQDGAEEASQ